VRKSIRIVSGVSVRIGCKAAEILFDQQGEYARIWQRLLREQGHFIADCPIERSGFGQADDQHAVAKTRSKVIAIAVR